MRSGYRDEFDITRNGFEVLRKLFWRTEWIFLATNEQTRNIQLTEVIDAQRLGFARWVQRVGATGGCNV